MREDAQTITRQSTIHGKYLGNSGYLLGNIEEGTQEFAGTGNHVNEGQTRQTDESQMMTSHRVPQVNCKNELHKRISQNKMMSRRAMEMRNDALGCSRATQVRMEYLRLVNLTEICPSQRVGHFKAPR